MNVIENLEWQIFLNIVIRCFQLILIGCLFFKKGLDDSICMAVRLLKDYLVQLFILHGRVRLLHLIMLSSY